MPSTAEIKFMLSSFDKGSQKTLETEHRREISYQIKSGLQLNQRVSGNLFQANSNLRKLQEERSGLIWKHLQ